MTAATVATADFQDALEWVTKCVPTRPALPVLGGIRMRFTDGSEPTEQGPGVVLSAFDYETSHTAHVSGMVTSVGEVLIPAVRARSLVATMRGNDLALEPGKSDGLAIHAGRTNLNLPGMPLADYPKLPGRPPTVGRIQADALLGLCRSTWHAAGKDAMLPVLTGLHLVADGDQLTAETTDRFRVCRRTITWDPKPADDTPVRMLAPARQLGAALTGLRGWVELGSDGKLLRLSTDEREVTIRMLDGEFPKLSSLWPTEDRWAVAVDIDIDEMTAALKRADLARDGHESCRLTVRADGITIDSSGEAAGADDVVDVATVNGLADGQEFAQDFNPVFVADALAAVATTGATTARLGLTAGNKPGVVTAIDNDDVAALVMPRRRTR